MGGIIKPVNWGETNEGGCEKKVEKGRKERRNVTERVFLEKNGTKEISTSRKQRPWA